MSLSVEKCLQAWTNSMRQMNAKADIVFFGDSMIYYGDFSALFSGKVVCNLGLRGDTLNGLKERVEQVRLLSPQRVYLMAGINDVSSYSLEVFGELYERLLMVIMDSLPGCELIVHSLLPANNIDYSISCNNTQIVECNNVISLLASKYGIRLIDIYLLYVNKGQLPKELTFDGLHLRETAYAKWYEALINDYQQFPIRYEKNMKNN